MSTTIISKATLEQFLALTCDGDELRGNPRYKAIIRKIVSDLCETIDQFDISDEEFWQAVNYFNFLGERKETALLAAGIGLEHFLDLRADAKEKLAGESGGTPRTIEGPLYVANAPLSDGFTRMDDGRDDGETMWLHGVVRDIHGEPIPGAVVDVWHANTLGNYSFFDKSQSDFNLRRRIVTDSEGVYRARSILPSGYGCPPDGPTQQLLDLLGRHGNRPAHVHFFVSAPGYKHLTTQINLNGDKYLWDDFAFATRDGLIADPIKITDDAVILQRELPGAHTEVNFDFSLQSAHDHEEEARVRRLRVGEV
ncbi:catechol 1,2-dioxygenase [Rosenbergiella collisarenosi]|uniref:catechol 1,2-dioxygenase n=1 Tax=Rosenbergiella collisarenosi TaxID=1544695 RepID=UPI001BDA528B|nr:catechol 1,2-dioxygenase [Rosenbergiella collisarenosi]MBT0720865.1 catechol 1,2-dioxygenase [Rosenbergiella collisarenosi]